MDFAIKRFSSMKIVSYCLFALSIIILGSTLYLLSDVRVVKDWKLILPQTQIHAGDQIILVSQYTKLRDTNGTATRYIECKNRTQNVFIRYPINEAVADRAKGKGGTGIQVVVPRTIPDLPTTCKFSISVVYDVLPFKKDIEKNSTADFILYPLQAQAADGGPK